MAVQGFDGPPPIWKGTSGAGDFILYNVGLTFMHFLEEKRVPFYDPNGEPIQVLELDSQIRGVVQAKRRATGRGQSIERRGDGDQDDGY